jgi:hypothetical protein
MMLIQRVADELRRFNFPGEAPSLQVKFSGDLSAIRSRPRRSNLARRSIAAWDLRDEGSGGRRGVGQPNA